MGEVADQRRQYRSYIADRIGRRSLIAQVADKCERAQIADVDDNFSSDCRKN